MDSTKPSDRRRPDRRPVVWGLGDFLWIYATGVLAGALLGSVGAGIAGDPVGDPGALAVGLAFLGQFGGWILGSVFVSRRKGRGTLRADFGLTVRLHDAWFVAVGVGLMIGSSLLVLPLVNLSGHENQDIVDELNKAGGLKLALIAVVAGLVAPVCEELLFRGLLLRSLRRRFSPELAVTFSALVFALAHPLLSPTLGTLVVVPALFVMGVVSGVMAVRRGDLSASIWLHVGFNLLTTLSALVSN